MKQLQKRAKKKQAAVAIVIKACLCLFVCSIWEGESGGCMQNRLSLQEESHGDWSLWSSDATKNPSRQLVLRVRKGKVASEPF